MSRAERVLGVLLSLCVLGCSGCSPLYLLEGAWVQGKILLSREPLADVLADPQLGAAEVAKLSLVQEARTFAAQGLGLDVGEAYGSFAVVPEGALVWVVSAARKDRLESYHWWFPVVGEVTYKGFFDQAQAQALAVDLRAEQWDVYVRTSSAFSTLGWFNDPILSSWLARDDVALVELILHELVHRSYYLSGHTDFNESFASWAGHAGAYLFFEQRDGEGAATTRLAQTRLVEALASSRRWTSKVGQLRELYEKASREQWSSAQILEERLVVFRSFPNPDRINNAVILAHWAYRRDLTGFACVAASFGKSQAQAMASIWSRAVKAEDPFGVINCQEAGPHAADASLGRL